MKILFAASEAAPIVKVGGLGDIGGTLPPALGRLGCDIRIALPLYLGVHTDAVPPLAKIASYDVMAHGKKHPVTVYRTELVSGGVPVYLFENKTHLSSSSHKAIYAEATGLKRFPFFVQAVREFLGRRIDNWTPDLIHCNDWHTALVPLALQSAALAQKPKTVLTIHNLPYQGLISADLVQAFGYDISGADIMMRTGPLGIRKRFVSILREGIKRADAITTVSPHYAKEIMTPEYGAGLEDALAARKDSVFGILNGIDAAYWNPQTDPLLAKQYEPHEYGSFPGRRAWKVASKKALISNDMTEAARNDDPIAAFVGRLDPNQKGIDILVETIETLLPENICRFIILATGDKAWAKRLRRLAQQYPEALVFIDRFDETAAHRIYAGADLMLVPSKYEPCGLIQMIAMRYGTIPVVRKTGGLADSVTDGRDGFVFEQYSAGELQRALLRALETRKNPIKWDALIAAAMKKDFSWEASAREYLALYGKVLHNEIHP